MARLREARRARRARRDGKPGLEPRYNGISIPFLIGRMSAEYGALIEQLSQMSQGNLRPEQSRLKFATGALEAAARDLAIAARGLREIEQIDSFAD